MQIISRFFIAVISIFALSGCSGERCIEADDFGHATFTVSSRYNSKVFEGQNPERQVAPWIDSNFRVNGRPLTILVRGWDYGVESNHPSDVSAWCGWFGDDNFSQKLSPLCEKLAACEFVGDMCTPDKFDADIVNAPCLFKNGVGLYALIAKKYTDPNQYISSIPEGINFHLGEDNNPKVIDIDKNGNIRKDKDGNNQNSGRIYNFSQSDAQQYADAKLYFKILDKHYNDNSGQYKVVIKSGITTSNPDVIQYVTNLVKDFLFGSNGEYGLIRNIFLNIVQNPGYQVAVGAILTLYIMFTAFSYLVGAIEVTQTEVIIRVAKIAIVSALINTSYSWDFFNDYLFAYFIGGVEQILSIIESAGGTGPGDPSIISLMLASETISKLLSLLFVTWSGWLYIILFFIALYFILMVFFEAAVIYLTAFMVIGMIIVMAPIFICFLLFDATKSLFENWLKQLISYALQPIILFTGLIFISTIMRQEIYGSLGFRVCKQDLFDMSEIDDDSFFTSVTKHKLRDGPEKSIFYWWFPNPMFGEDFARTKSNIQIPIDHYASDPNTPGAVSNDGFCPAYACVGQRYHDLPFLDPDDESDQRRIIDFHNGVFTQFDGLLLIFVSIYLLKTFNTVAVSTARFLTGTSGNYADISGMGSSVLSGIRTGALNLAVGMQKADKLRASRDSALGAIRNAPELLTRKALDKAFDDAGKVNDLRKESLSNKSNQLLHDKALLDSGVKDLNKDAPKKYQEELASRLKEIDPKLSNKRANKLAEEMSGKKYGQLKEEFALAKYKKSHDQLSDSQKKTIDNILGKTPEERMDLRVLARENSEARRFQDSYVKSYIELSNKGVGIVGKKVADVGKIEEFIHKAQEDKKRSEFEKQQRGEKIVSGLEEIKHKAYSQIRDPNDAFGHNLAGGAWHNVNTTKPSRTTYAEDLANRDSISKQESLMKQIESKNELYGARVTSPEFLSSMKQNKPEMLSSFEGIARQEIRYDVRNELMQGSDPSKLGETYMSRYAKDSEMSHCIDRAYEIEQEILRKDEFLSRENDYVEKFEIAQEQIDHARDKLEDQYGKDIEMEDMPSLLEESYDNLGVDINKNEAFLEVQKLKKAIDDYQESKQTIDFINQRKEMIHQEIETHVDSINNHRSKAGMDKYKPK